MYPPSGRCHRPVNFSNSDADAGAGWAPCGRPLLHQKPTAATMATTARTAATRRHLRPDAANTGCRVLCAFFRDLLISPSQFTHVFIFGHVKQRRELFSPVMCGAYLPRCLPERGRQGGIHVFDFSCLQINRLNAKGYALRQNLALHGRGVAEFGASKIPECFCRVHSQFIWSLRHHSPSRNPINNRSAALRDFDGSRDSSAR